MRAVKQLRPLLVILENVEGIDVDADAADGDEAPTSNLDVVLGVLGDLGYATAAKKILATEYGLPQRRRRFYIFGVKVTQDILLDSAKATVQRAAAMLSKLRVNAAPAVLSLENIVEVYAVRFPVFAFTAQLRFRVVRALPFIPVSLGNVPSP